MLRRHELSVATFEAHPKARAGAVFGISGPLHSHRRGVSSAPQLLGLFVVHHVQFATLLRAALRAASRPSTFL